MIQKIILILTSLLFVISCASTTNSSEDGRADNPENIDSEITFDGVGAADDDPFFSDPDPDESPQLDVAEGEDQMSNEPEPEVNIPEPTAQAEPALDIPASEEEEMPVAEVEDDPTPSTSKKSAYKKTSNAMRAPASNCNMRAGPGAGKSKVGKLKKGRKVWTENHNGGWFKIYRKKGHAFVSKNCF